MLIAVIVALAPSAAADELQTTNVAPRDPLVVEWLTVELSAPPLGIGLLSGAHTWLTERWLLGARGAVRQMAITRDLNGDGTSDFARTLGNNPLHVELQADAAYALRLARDRVSFGSGVRRVTRDETGRNHIRWTETTTIERVRDLSLALGVRAAVGGDEFQLGIPVGLRLGSRLRTKGPRFRERWVQARVILIPQRPTAGVDAEVVYMPAIYGLSAQFEYFPKIGNTDPAGPQCELAPQRCTPATPVTSFNRIPDQSMWQISVRIRVTTLR